jgi:hypothetical protein
MSQNRDRAIAAQVALKAVIELQTAEVLKLDVSDPNTYATQIAPWVEAITNVLVEAGGETTTDEATEEKAVSNVVKAFPGTKVVCPQCGSDTWDNTIENQQRIAQGLKPRPRYRCKSCDWIKW